MDFIKQLSIMIGFKTSNVSVFDSIDGGFLLCSPFQITVLQLVFLEMLSNQKILKEQIVELFFLDKYHKIKYPESIEKL